MKITADTSGLLRTPVISLQTLCEVSWVLKVSYDAIRANIVAAIKALINTSNVVTNCAAAEAGLAVLEAGGDFADGVIVFDGAWLGADTFVSGRIRTHDRSGHPCVPERSCTAQKHAELCFPVRMHRYKIPCNECNGEILPMAMLTVRNLPDEVHRALRVRAANTAEVPKRRCAKFWRARSNPRRVFAWALASLGCEIGLTNDDFVGKLCGASELKGG